MPTLRTEVERVFPKGQFLALLQLGRESKRSAYRTIAPATNMDPGEPTHLWVDCFYATQHFEPKGPAVVERLMAYMCYACKVYSHP